jgi:hypothetical protein
MGQSEQNPKSISFKAGLFIFIGTLILGALVLGGIILFYSPGAADPLTPADTPLLQPTATFTDTLQPTSTLAPTDTLTFTPTLTETPTPTSTESLAIPPTRTSTPTRKGPTRSLPTSTRISPPVSASSALAAVSSLNYYHLQGKITMTIGGESSAIAESITQDWDKKSHASHTLLILTYGDEPGSTTTLEMIAIGNTLWTKTDGQWRRDDSSQPQTTQNGMEGLDSFIPEMKLVGKQTVDGIPCNHYVVDADLDMPGGGAGSMTTHVSGDIWVANKSGLPQVVVKIKLHILIGSGGSPLAPPGGIPRPNEPTATEITADMQFDLTRINVPVKIMAPK